MLGNKAGDGDLSASQPKVMKQHTLQQLPEEVLLSIFKRLDGRSLGCASGVCSKWNKFINTLAQGPDNVWFRICLKELGLETMITQTGLTWLAASACNPQAKPLKARWRFWRDLFVANYRCWCVNRKNWEVCFNTVDVDSCDEENEVTSVAIHPCSLLQGDDGKYFAGFRNGITYVFQAGSGFLMGSFPCLPLAPHVTACTSLVTVTAVSVDYSGGGQDSGKEEIFLLSSSQSGDIKITSTETMEYNVLYGIGNQIFSISAVGKYFAVGTDSCQREGVVVYRLTQTLKEPFDLQQEAVLRLRGCLHSELHAVALAHDQVTRVLLKFTVLDKGWYCGHFLPARTKAQA